MKIVSLYLLPLLSLLLSVPALAERIELSDRRLLQTDLLEARLISEIDGYAILSGRSCIDCDENTSIYIHRINDGPLELASSNGERYSYPGRYAHYMTKKVVEKTRVFYGNCYEGQQALLWLSEYLPEEGDEWVKEEYLIVFGEDGLEHRYNENRQPSIFYIENKECVELPGVDMEIEP